MNSAWVVNIAMTFKPSPWPRTATIEQEPAQWRYQHQGCYQRK